MSDYISREDAVGVIEKEMKNYISDIWYKSATHSALNDVNENIKSLEPADVAPVVHSQWVFGGYDDMYYICKRCGHKQSEYYSKPTANYCPNCGAKMDGKE